jgi:hypothetical protein
VNSPQVSARIVRAPHLGYYAYMTQGIMRVGEPGALPWALTRRGIERKAARIARRLRRDAARRQAADVLYL